MAINTRQNSLLVAENWKKIYQTFQEADFTSYDFETLRKSMIDYLKTYYPEDFNDFTDSSEFIALIDLIAFMGQSLAFRTDLNARENYIDTAERRDSILKLARLVSYNPKRNISSSGMLKIDSVSTTESVYDSNGLNLTGVVVNWNDSTNDSWLEQFNSILNSSLSTSQVIGKPGNTQTIDGVRTEEYSVNIIPSVLNVFRFEQPIESMNMTFEAVSATSLGQSYVYEVPPKTNNFFNILYRNDNYGNGSNDTGFFVYFKQGTLASQDFAFGTAIPNRVQSFSNGNVNNTDVWVYSLDTNGSLQDLWTGVPAVAGLNVIYTKQSQRNLYQVNSRVGDQIDLVFGDGSFANIPQGNFRLYYRSGNGLSYKITPDEMQNITIPMQYVSRSGRSETLTIRASLHYTVANATARETLEQIRQRAPQTYYTQNRMITGEDYNIVPFTSFTNIIKVKSINRTSSGLSRFLDTLDSTGKFSSTNVIATDGIIYANPFMRNFKSMLFSNADILNMINQHLVSEVVASTEMMHLYYASYPKYAVPDCVWNLSTVGSNSSTGYFIRNSKPLPVSGRTGGDPTAYIRKGAVIRFDAPPGHYFDINNNLLVGSPSLVSDRLYVHAGVQELYGDGTNNGLGNFISGIGPVTLNIMIPNGSVVGAVYPVFKNNFTNILTNSIVTLMQGFKTFGIRYDSIKQIWKIIAEENLGAGDFSLTHQGDTSATGLDDSWLIKAMFSDNAYNIYYRGLEYIFQSAGETTFFFDNKNKVYDTKSGTVLHDQITVLKINPQADSSAPLGHDYTWYIDKPIVGTDGFSSNDKILVTFQDSNGDNMPDDPSIFESVVVPNTNPTSKFVYFRVVPGYDRFQDTISIDTALVFSRYATYLEIQTHTNIFQPGQLFYATSENTFYQLNSSRMLELQTDYMAKTGRQSLAFQYRHNSPSNRRIDPANSNINDLYLLTSSYWTDYQNWIKDTSNKVTKPMAPSSQELSSNFDSLNNQRSVSDTIVFNSAVFKPIFGKKADTSLQAIFKVVKNPSITTSDNDIKSSVVNAINTYFDIDNWDFGEPFYFSELGAYLHQVLSPSIASIVIVPANAGVSFGNLYQINAEPYEIIISAATVENVEIITSISAAQLNMGIN
jgi:hypothetical protein